MINIIIAIALIIIIIMFDNNFFDFNIDEFSKYNKIDKGNKRTVWVYMKPNISRNTRDSESIGVIKLCVESIKKHLGNNYNVIVFLGSELDLVDRYWQAALSVNADIVVRLPADNATPQWDEIDRIIDHHISLGRPGFSSNICNFWDSGYPDGIGAEVFDMCLLRDIVSRNLLPYNREHVHTNFFNYETGEPADSGWCPVSTVQCREEIRRPDLILDVNTQEQYDFIKKLYEALYPGNSNFSIADIINWYDNEYQIK